MKKLLVIFLVCTAFNNISPSLSETDLEDEIRPLNDTNGTVKDSTLSNDSSCEIKNDHTFNKNQPDGIKEVASILTNIPSSEMNIGCIGKKNKLTRTVEVVSTFSKSQFSENNNKICPDQCCKFLESFFSIVKSWVVSNDHKNQ